MPAGRAKKKPKDQSAEPRPKFAPAAFLSGSPEQVQTLCNDLAELAAERFSDLTGTTWVSTGQALASQLRALGHDLMSFEDTARAPRVANHLASSEGYLRFYAGVSRAIRRHRYLESRRPDLHGDALAPLRSLAGLMSAPGFGAG